MDVFKGSRAQELEQLRVDLVRAARLLDELEWRQTARAQARAADLIFETAVYPSEAETRFAACVSYGLSKSNSK
jgi:hypothetical protein